MSIEQEITEALETGAILPEDALQAVEQLLADPEAIEEAKRKAAEDRRMRLSALGQRLMSDAKQQEQLRQITEERWYQDVRQFNGQYDPGFFASGNAYGSRVFVPLTRRLVGLCEARLCDMLFQSDQRFYAIEPTPVPDIDQADSLSNRLPNDHPVQMPDGVTLSAGSIQGAIKQLIEEAKASADAMQREIDDQLAECRFPQVARDVIHDAVLLGTGVIKGPCPMIRNVKRWVSEGGMHALEVDSRPVPVAERVDPWNFFPDMSATHISEAEFVFERHYMTRKQVGGLRDMPDVDQDALNSILAEDPTTPTSNYRERLRSINGASGAIDKRYELWEYHGPISVQELTDCGCDVDEDDNLTQYTGIVWFCNGVVLKAALTPLDSGDLPYRVFTWQKDETNIFGFGIPYEVRDQQVSANASWRAMLDNMGLCVMPQVVIDEGSIEPVDGSLGLTPGKVWRNKRPGSDARQGLQLIDINARMPELQQIFTTSKALIEEVGTMPGFMQGADAPSKMQSATEASISWTAANLWVRRCVRNWDDDITTPLISGFYDYNMQWSEKEEIKGDSKIRAMGISYLAELEGQATRMQQLAQAAQGLGLPMSTQYAMLRELSRSLKLDPDRWLPTEQEVQKMKQAEQANGPQTNIEQMKLQVAQENNQMDYQAAMAGMDLKRDEIAARRQDMQDRMRLEVTQAAAQQNITQQEAQRKYGFDMAKIDAEMTDRERERQSKAQMLNAEMQLKAQMGTGV